MSSKCNKKFVLTSNTAGAEIVESLALINELTANFRLHTNLFETEQFEYNNDNSLSESSNINSLNVQSVNEQSFTLEGIFK